MDRYDFEESKTQKYRNESEKITYILTYIGDDYGYEIRSYDDRFINLSNYDGDFLGTTANRFENVAMMAWDYNAVPVKEV